MTDITSIEEHASIVAPETSVTHSVQTPTATSTSEARGDMDVAAVVVVAVRVPGADAFTEACGIESGVEPS